MAEVIKGPLLRFVVHGHVLLAAGAAAQVWWVNDLLFHADATLPWFAALVTFACYGAMRLLRMHAPGLENDAMMQWYRANARTMVVLVALAALGALVLGWPLRMSILHALWLPALLSAGYILPLRLSGGRPIGLRRLPLLKAFLIAWVWASLVVLLPAVWEFEGEVHLGSDAWIIAAIWAGYFLGIAIAFDIRDLPFDHPGMWTLPRLLGVRGAKVLGVLALTPLFFMLLTMLAISYTPIEPGWREPRIDLSLLLPLVGVVYTMVLIVRSSATRPGWFYAVALDGSLLLIPGLAWVGGLLHGSN